MDLTHTDYYINRELSWLEFNERVLEEALDKINPLMERLKFLAITASNLDEFFMVRVSSLWEQESANIGPDLTGLTPIEQLKIISSRVHDMSDKQYHCLMRLLLPALEKEQIVFLDYAALDANARAYVDDYFEGTVYPVLTPMAIDQSRPFPVLNNRTVNIFIELAETEQSSEPKYALVQLPTILPRILPLTESPLRNPSNGLPQGTSAQTGRQFILLENIIHAHIGRLFPGYTVRHASELRVTRNSDLDIDEEEISDLMDEMERSIKRRRWGDPVRIEVTRDMDEDALAFLKKSLDLEDDEIYQINGPLDLTVFMGFASAPEFARLRNKPLLPRPVPAFMDCASLFEVIRKRDVLVHHPYHSFDCVVRFVKEAAADPHVLAIKQTLYRVSGQSPIVSALIEAAGNGKQVTVLVELKARFDEENNINWARKLEQSGCHVVYGLVGLKTHCKVCLVVRREDDGIRRYVHFGTGNYNDATARIYTDSGYFTCKETFGRDSSSLFNVLTGYSKTMDWQKIAVAPVGLRAAFLRLIEAETKNAREGKPASVTAKMNSLSDVEMIQALYRASMAGVIVRLLVRGICCLRAGIPGVSENITVSSIVDRFLEHTRIYIFENDGNNRVFLSSADWMPRNLDRRVETLIPIEEPALRGEIIQMLELSLSDNVKRRVQQPDGSYRKPDRRGRRAVQSQLVFHRQAADAYKAAQEDVRREVFRPAER